MELIRARTPPELTIRKSRARRGWLSSPYEDFRNTEAEIAVDRQRRSPRQSPDTPSPRIFAPCSLPPSCASNWANDDALLGL